MSILLKWGFSNAYTSFMETNYYYKINNDALEKSYGYIF